MNASYGFGGMEIGEERFFPDNPTGTLSRPAVAARAYSNYHGGKFVFTCKSENGGVTVKRIAERNKISRAKPDAPAISKMCVGDSMFVAGAVMTSPEVIRIRHQAKEIRISLTMRTVDGGVRIWRVA